ncbi:MAG: PTS sugar transporter subunit IIA [Candidatus Brocadiaceae bacterium]|nr:PTS sugar transporter subunit IIA [Candidatus Brocadiaceae bacterium]
MDLAECLARGALCMALEPRKRDDALRVMLDELVQSNALRPNIVDSSLEAVLDRERLGSTAIGKGVAVPHARVDNLDRIVVAFGHSEDGIEFRALDGAPVHEVFLVLAPSGAAAEYLALMQQITRLVQDDDFRRFVGVAKSGQEVLDLIREMAS